MTWYPGDGEGYYVMESRLRVNYRGWRFVGRWMDNGSREESHAHLRQIRDWLRAFVEAQLTGEWHLVDQGSYRRATEIAPAQGSHRLVYTLEQS